MARRLTVHKVIESVLHPSYDHESGIEDPSLSLPIGIPCSNDETRTRSPPHALSQPARLNPITLIGERREPHTYRTAEKNLRHNRRAERAPHLSYSGEKSSSYIYICFLYIYIYIYIRSYVVHARATRKRRTGRLRFNGQYNRLKNGYFSSKL